MFSGWLSVLFALVLHAMVKSVIFALVLHAMVLSVLFWITNYDYLDLVYSNFPKVKKTIIKQLILKTYFNNTVKSFKYMHFHFRDFSKKKLCSWICKLLWLVHTFIVTSIRWILISLFDTIDELPENWFTRNNSEFIVGSLYYLLST